MSDGQSLNALVEFTAAILAPMSLGMLLDYYCSARQPAMWTRLRKSSDQLANASLFDLHRRVAKFVVTCKLFKYGYFLGTIKYLTILCLVAIGLLNLLGFKTPEEVEFEASMRVLFYGFLLFVISLYVVRRFSRSGELEFVQSDASGAGVLRLTWLTVGLIWRAPQMTARWFVTEGQIRFGINTRIHELSMTKSRPIIFRLCWGFLLVVPVYLCMVICALIFFFLALSVFVLVFAPLLESFGFLGVLPNNSVFTVVYVSLMLDALSLWITIRLLRMVARSGAWVSILIVFLDVLIAVLLAASEVFISFYFTYEIQLMYVDQGEGALEGPGPVAVWIYLSCMTALVPTLLLGLVLIGLAMVKIGQSASYGFARFVLNLMALEHDENTARPFTTVGALCSGYIVVRYYLIPWLLR